VSEHVTSEERATLSQLADLVDRVEHESRLDGLASMLSPLANRLSAGPQAPILRGDPLGHALHPLLTDIPIGCFTSSCLLDLVGGRRSRRASQALVGIGLLSLAPTAAAGLVDWQPIADSPRRRAGAVHAVCNTVAGLLYFWSWRQRRRDHHFRGVAIGLAGAAVASVAGYLGGHLAFARHTGIGERGEPESPALLEDEHALDGKIGG